MRPERCYLVVGVGWNCSFNLWADIKRRAVGSVNSRYSMNLQTDDCFYYLHSHWLCSTKGSSMSSCFMKDVLISCTQSREEKSFHTYHLTKTQRGVCVCTSMVRVCVSEGTHSKASSAQQPPHRFTDTQDGTKRWWISPGNSRQTSTRVSRGSQPLREYTSNHRRTDRHTKHVPGYDFTPSTPCMEILWRILLGIPSRPSLDLGESAGRQWASWRDSKDGEREAQCLLRLSYN